MKYDQQLRLPLCGEPQEINLDGVIRQDIRYLGKAILQGDGKYRVLADISGCLCVVAVTISDLEN